MKKLFFVFICIVGVFSFYFFSKSAKPVNINETEKVKPRKKVKVENSSWDASVSQVKSYLKNTLKDPKSVEYIEWSKVVETYNGYQVRCKYRAKNSLGGYVLKNQIFFLDFNGNVIKTSNL